MNGWTHKPILADDICKYLITDLRGVYLDGTLGLGGHTKGLLAALGARGRVIGLDKDRNALAMAAQNVNDGRLSVFNTSYLEAPRVLEDLNLKGFNGVLFDLGLSSYQLDDACRGFSFLRDGPLDMRFDNSRGKTAADIVNNWPADKLEDIFKTYGDERRAAEAALAICRARKDAKINTTGRLAAIVERALCRTGKTHPATRLFQALRIAVNDELDAVRALPGLLAQLLLPGGRAAFLTFHSTEDRIIKYGLRELTEAGGWALVNKKVIEPSFREIKENPRARSAKLRVIEREK
jgi:16S rRNA (cytosine1402-N4)-methyltransferase